MSPAAHALDRRLQELRSEHDEYVARIANLEADPTYVRLVGDASIGGVTAARVGPAAQALAELREPLAVLGQLIERVGAARGWGTLDDNVATALFAQLNSPTIGFPSAPQGVTPHELLSMVRDACSALETVVVEVATIWHDLDLRLGDARSEAQRLAVARPGFRIVAAAREALDGLAEKAVTDPLGMADDLTTVESALATAVSAGDEVDRLSDVLAIARQTLAEIETLVGEGRNALALSRAEVTGIAGLLDPIDPEVITGERGLRPWLERLEALVARGDVALASKGLESWTALADKTLATAREVAEANARPTKRRRELRSLLRAARVKAGASGRAEDPLLTDLFRRADRALDVPCHLEVAEAEVEAYLVELRRTPTPEQALRTASVPVVTAPWAPDAGAGSGPQPPAPPGVQPPPPGPAGRSTPAPPPPVPFPGVADGHHPEARQVSA
ncbi:MAG TPA: hypothetical protein VIL36_07420 [Acidimicrobiales bacterium]